MTTRISLSSDPWATGDSKRLSHRDQPWVIDDELQNVTVHHLFYMEGLIISYIKTFPRHSMIVRYNQNEIYTIKPVC